MDIYDMYLSGMTCSEISKVSLISTSTIRRRMIKKGIMRSKSEGAINSVKLGKWNKHNSHKKGVPLSSETKIKISKSKLLLNKGSGFRVTKAGYIEITKGENKGRLEHVIKMEEKIGRRLFSNECVHHKDHNKKNNNIENLQLMTRSEHAKLHAKENNLNRKRNERGMYL